MRSFNGIEFISNPAWARGAADQDQHRLHRALDVEAVRSPLADRRPGRHAHRVLLRSLARTRRSTTATSSSTGAPTCGTSSTRPAASRSPRDGTFQPCPVDNYHTGGFGLIKKATGARWMADLKSTHLFEAGGHHEIKYGWHPEYVTYDQERCYSGPLGQPRAGPALPAAAAASTPTPSSRCSRASSPSDFGTGVPRPATDLLYPPALPGQPQGERVKSLVERVLPAGQLQPARRCAT